MYLTQLKKSPICRVFKIGVSKKIKKLIKMRKLKKQITKKTELWKKTDYNFEKTNRFGLVL